MTAPEASGDTNHDVKPPLFEASHRKVPTGAVGSHCNDWSSLMVPLRFKCLRDIPLRPYVPLVPNCNIDITTTSILGTIDDEVSKACDQCRSRFLCFFFLLLWVFVWIACFCMDCVTWMQFTSHEFAKFPEPV